MAYSYTFKRGKDLSGNDLPNHFFVNGNIATTGTGTSLSPFKTILEAKNALSGSTQQTIVVAPFDYQNDLVNASFPSNNFKLLGDSDNYDVVVSTNQAVNRPFNGGADWYAENIVFKGYDMGYNLPNYNTYHHAKNCIYLDCTKVAESSGFGGAVGDGLVVANSKFVTTVDTAGHSLYNCEIQNDGNVRNAKISYSFIDANCSLNINSGADTLTFDNCYFEDKVSFLATKPALLTVVITDEITTDPRFNYVSGTDQNGNTAQGGFDFTVSSRLSSLIQGQIRTVGGKVFKGLSFNTSDTYIQSLIALETDLEIFNGNIRFKNTVPTGTVVEIGENGELPFVASTRKPLTIARISGVGYNAGVELYIRTKYNASDISFSDWKKYRFGEPMGVDLSGKTTGENGFSWHEIQPVLYAVAQAKLVLTKQ
jgi:hypothetical protein